MKTFLVSYSYEGARWNIDLPANDFHDAEARLQRLKFATVDGEVKLTVPAPAGPLAALVVWIKNTFRADKHD